LLWPAVPAVAVGYGVFAILGAILLSSDVAQFVLVLAGVALAIALGYTALTAGRSLYRDWV
jgi:uncharacterized membrane protein